MAFRVAAAEARALHRQHQDVKISFQDKNGEIDSEFCLCGKFTIENFERAVRLSR